MRTRSLFIRLPFPHAASCVVALLLVNLGQSALGTGVTFEGAGPNFLASRWDAAPRISAVGGLERSLDGGLRYSLAGGSVSAFRDSFSWSGGVPSLLDFSNSLDNAFNVWRTPDPGLNGAFPTQLTFVDDTANVTATDGNIDTGAEIDLLPFDFGGATFNGTATTGTVSSGANVTLTSGSTVATNSYIRGSDIRMNSNAGAFWTLGLFETVLGHEIGHALGLDDVDVNSGPNGTFIDDNYDGTSAATINATLTNNFSALIDITDPEGSAGLSRFTVPTANFDIGLPLGTNLLPDLFMESNGDNVGLVLGNDALGGRQYLYPVAALSSGSGVIPEPSTLGLLALLLPFLRRKRRLPRG